MTQNNLGNALAMLGERESGTARLIEAVEAYRSALREHTQERVPLDWAMTQDNLGSALARLGERESGTARLTEAVEAFQNALRERTQERVPFDWAATQTNMGNALRLLAERNRDVDSAKQAVAAQEAALVVCRAAGADYYIEVASDNLALARATLAKLEGGADSPPHQ
jgi:tetratricopeptide (TPR) repeat protein